MTSGVTPSIDPSLIERVLAEAAGSGEDLELRRAALVLTGVTTPDELAGSDVQPDGVYSGLTELFAAWPT